MTNTVATTTAETQGPDLGDDLRDSAKAGQHAASQALRKFRHTVDEVVPEAVQPSATRSSTPQSNWPTIWSRHSTNFTAACSRLPTRHCVRTPRTIEQGHHSRARRRARVSAVRTPLLGLHRDGRSTPFPPASHGGADGLRRPGGEGPLSYANMAVRGNT